MRKERGERREEEGGIGWGSTSRVTHHESRITNHASPSGGHQNVLPSHDAMTTPDAHRDLAFPVLGDDEIAALSEVGIPRTFRDGESLFQVGERRGGFFVVLSGGVEVIDRSGDEPRRVALHERGEFTGDVDVLSGRRPVVSAVARGETELLEISSSDVRRIISERPALGEPILQAFIARREQLMESGFEGLRVIGRENSREAFRIREFLARNQVPFTWIDLDSDSAVGELMRHFGLDESDTPVVAYGGQPLMRNPSLREIAEVVGLKRSLGNRLYDLVVVGAGPAGLGAAVYAASEGLSTVVLDQMAPGGQAGASSKIENYLGFPTGISGEELTGRATLQAQKFGARFSTPSSATALDPGGHHPVVQIEDGERVTARCVLIATGAEYRKLDVPGREEFDGRGVYYAATQTELVTCEGSDVVVVGGGNSSGQAAMFLSEHTRRVILMLRSDDLREDMSSYLVERIEEAPNIEVLLHTEIRRILGDERLQQVEIEDTNTGEVRRMATSAVFTFIGAAPRTGWLPPEIETDDRGFILTGRAVSESARSRQGREPYLLETSRPGVFAAGDVRQGSTQRVASAVGEGAMAVKFIHAYLADHPA
jgi:thioredoxin reductase (NADPH)